MIDTYFDRVDAAQGYRPAPCRPASEDPRYWNGQLYATMIDRNAAVARERLAGYLNYAARHHLWEIRLGIRLGSDLSIF